MRAIIFINGIIENDPLTAQWLRDDDYLIGADGGTYHCLRLDRQPHLVVGDLDSLDSATIEELTAAGVQIQRHPPEKDYTDLELAIECAVEAGADEILLLGALGGRMDQMLGNVLILAYNRWPIPIRLAEGNQLAQVMQGPAELLLSAAVGGTISVIPLTPTVTGITYSGLQYPLHNATLHLGSSRGMSNVMRQEQAAIEIATGALMVVQTLL